MGLRFRRSWSVFPGVRLNLGLKSGSVSFGARGLHYTVGTTGSRITAGIPGTGLFWTQKLKSAPGYSRLAAANPPRNYPAGPIAAAPKSSLQPGAFVPPVGHQTQYPSLAAGQVKTGTVSGGFPSQKHVFIPLWVVWTALGSGCNRCPVRGSGSARHSSALKVTAAGANKHGNIGERSHGCSWRASKWRSGSEGGGVEGQPKGRGLSRCQAIDLKSTPTGKGELSTGSRIASRTGRW